MVPIELDGTMGSSANCFALLQNMRPTLTTYILRFQYSMRDIQILALEAVVLGKKIDCKQMLELPRALHIHCIGPVVYSSTYFVLSILLIIIFVFASILAFPTNLAGTRS